MYNIINQVHKNTNLDMCSSYASMTRRQDGTGLGESQLRTQ
jgi:hypothetical protein